MPQVHTIITKPSKLGLKELIAIGVGGMIGGGIFSVMGLAVGITGNATPIAFLLGGLLALIMGYSYVKLAVAFHSDGASFTYLEVAFPHHKFIGTITGWTVIIGYIGTLALYAFTFGAYGAELLGTPDGIVRQMLSVGIVLLFMMINLIGTKTLGKTEDLIVYGKIILLGLLAFAGMQSIEPEMMHPVFDHGFISVFMAAALIFVAFEGFQLITNGVCETENPKKNIGRGIYGSIAIVTLIYVVLSLVAIGSLSEAELVAAEEYALAVAAEPSMGNAGRVLVSIAALLATASAINATMFGASRMMAEMATEHEMPRPFSFRNRESVPWIAVVVLTILTILLTYFGGLELIASFSSMTFLLVSLAVNIANFKLRHKTKSNPYHIVLGSLLVLFTIGTLVVYLANHSPEKLIWILSVYALLVVSEAGYKWFTRNT
ncbi:MAG: amino acid permease [Epsilonproteobacteria bacterium]|nr:MAG: amino acid permease [Campylobacterota bacterium]